MKISMAFIERGESKDSSVFWHTDDAVSALGAVAGVVNERGEGASAANHL